VLLLAAVVAALAVIRVSRRSQGPRDGSPNNSAEAHG
jgi:hypothetical protein